MCSCDILLENRVIDQHLTGELSTKALEQVMASHSPLHDGNTSARILGIENPIGESDAEKILVFPWFC